MGTGIIAGGKKDSKEAKERVESLIGRTISDRYKIVDVIAMGGLGAVYRAKHMHMRKELAVKVLHPESENFPELVARFEREAVAGAHITHKNVANASDFGKFDGESRFLVQEYVEGETVNDILARGPVPVEKAAEIAKQMAAGLGAAHENGIIHRDVKPRNIMVSGDGDDMVVKLIDFGLAKVPVDELTTASRDPDWAPERDLTNAGVVMGTVAYMAPETALGMSNVRERADLYSLGLIFYEMITGLHPFDATDPTVMFAKQRTEMPPPISTRNPNVKVSGALEQVIMKLLAKDPSERYPDASAVIAAIEAAMSPGPKLAAPTSAAAAVVAPAKKAASVAPKSMAKKPQVAWLVAAVAIVAVIVLAAIVLSQDDSPAAPVASASTPPVEPTTPPTADKPPPAPVKESALAKLNAAVAEGGSQGAQAALALAKSDPKAFDDPALQAVAAQAAVKAASEDAAETNALFTMLANDLGSAGLDVLYDVMVRESTSPAAGRARALLGDPKVIERGTPAMRIAYDLSIAACDRRPYLMTRAAEEGDDRALAVIKSMQPPACEPGITLCCYRRHGDLERAEAAIQARLRR